MDEQMYEQMLLRVLSRDKMFFEQTMMWNKKIHSGKKLFEVIVLRISVTRF